MLQVAGAIVDLIDMLGASVMLLLEDGWDFTAQVSQDHKSYLCYCFLFVGLGGFSGVLNYQALVYYLGWKQLPVLYPTK